MVLHDVANDAEFVEVSSATLRTEGLLEGNLHVVDVVAVPCSAEEGVAKPQDQNVLHHLLSEVVVDTEQFLFLPIWLQRLLELSGASKVLAEWFLNLVHQRDIGQQSSADVGNNATYNDTGNALCGIAASLQVLGDNSEHARRQSHVKQTVCLFAPLLEVFQMLVEVQEGFILVVLAGHIGAELAEILQHLLHIFGRGLDVGLDSAQVFLMVHLCSGIANDLDVLGQELVAVLKVWVSRAPCRRTSEFAGICLPDQTRPGTADN